MAKKTANDASAYHSGASLGVYGCRVSPTMPWMTYAARALAPSVSSTPRRQRDKSQATTNSAYTTCEKPAPKTRYEGLPARWLMIHSMCRAFSGCLLSLSRSSSELGGATNGGSARTVVAFGSSTRDRQDSP